MFCEYCRHEISDDAEYCPNCGMTVRKITAPASDARITQIIDQDDIEAELEEAKKQKKPTELDKKLTQVKLPDMSGLKDGLDGIGDKIKEVKVDEIKDKFLGVSDKINREVVLGAPVEPKLAEGEVVVKKYNCADIRNVKGYLTVTNKRLMFNASGGQSRFSQEVTLSSVSGLTCYRGKNYYPIPIIIGVIIALAGLMSMFSGGGGYGYGYGGGGTGILGLFLILIGVLLVFSGIKTAFQIAVYAKDVSLSPIVVGEGPKSIIGNSALIAVVSKATPDTDRMLSELGAVVQDLQTMGDLAINKWRD